MAVKDRIARVGIELEGGWMVVPPGERCERDGSVIFLPEAGKIAPINKGEIISRPLLRSEMRSWMERSYPSHVNATCGLHVHMSFRHHHINYMRLMTPAYTEAIVRGLARWAAHESLPPTHPLWDRLGKRDHHHCAHQYLGDQQVHVDHKDYHSRGKPHSRYTAINYCFKLHKTLECRILPMFDTSDQAVRAVDEVLNITNMFLATIRLKETRIQAKVALRSVVRSVYRSTV